MKMSKFHSLLFYIQYKNFLKSLCEKIFFVYNKDVKRKWLKPVLMAFMICLSLALVGVGGFLFAGCTKNKGVQGDAAVSYKWKVSSDTVKAITFNFTTNSGTSASYVQNTWLNEWMQDTVSKTSNFTLYRHTFGTMYQSTNGGSSWMSSGTDEVIYSTQSTAYTANTVYAGAAPP